MAPKPNPGARVEIDSATLARLLATRQMHVCELKCLDAPSKSLVRQLCLEACLEACSRKSS